MSQNSAKQKYTQFMSWLESRSNKKQNNDKKESRLSYNKSKGFNGGRNSGQSNRRR